MKPFVRDTLLRQKARLHELDALLSAPDVVSDLERFRTLSRERGKDMASDYRAKNVGTEQSPKAAEPRRSMFDGLKLTVSRAALGDVAAGVAGTVPAVLAGD